jgi:GT2 family glycosyltransferase
VKKTVAEKTPMSAPRISLIVVPRVFPNQKLEEFIQSTTHIKTEYEVIIITSIKPQTNIAKENLQPILNANPRCCRATLIALGMDPGLAQGRNIGAASAQSSNLLFSDDDIILSEDITPLIEQLDNGGYESIQPLLLRYSDPNMVDSAGDRIVHLNGMYHAVIRGAGQKLGELNYKLVPEQLPSLRGAFFAVKKQALVDVGGFDGSLGFNFDDVDLCWRLTLAGYRNVFAPTVCVLHRGGRTTNAKALDERAQRFHLVNHHAIQLKVAGLAAWPFIFGRFELFALKHALSLGQGGTLLELVDMNRMMIERFGAVNRHRRILSRHHWAGRKTFKAMAEQQRYPIAKQ